MIVTESKSGMHQIIEVATVIEQWREKKRKREG